MATTNLYNSISGLLEISEKLNTKLTSFIETGAYKPVLANGSTSGLVYGGGDVTITNGQITIATDAVVTAKIKNGNVTADKLATDAVTTVKIKNGNVSEAKLDTALTGKIKNGVDAWGKVSGSTGTWHSHDNKTVLDGISSTNVSNWNDANTKKHTHANSAVLDEITADDITAWDNGALVSAVTLEKLSTATTGYAATYQLKVNGAAVGSKIDIVKDQFLKSGSLVKGTWSTGTTPTFTPSTSGTQYALALELYVRSDGGAGSTTTTVYIDVRNLVDVYTGANGVKVDGYVISLSGLPSDITITSGQLPTIPSSLLADKTTYQTAVNRAADWNTAKATVVKTSSATTFKDGTVVLGNGSSQTVKNSEYTVVSASGNFGANTLATAPAITGYIAAQGFQKSADMTNYVTAAADLDAETIVMGAGARGVVKGTKIVSTSGDIAATSGATMVPTAGAVSSYVANKTTSMVTGSGLTANYLVAGNGDGKVKITGIASGNVVTASANLAANDIVLGAGANKTIQKSGYTINTTATSGAISGNGANQIPNVQAVKAYTDAQDTAAKNYLLNGNAGTSTGVSDWGGAATAEGSLAYLNAQISDLLTRVSA